MLSERWELVNRSPCRHNHLWLRHLSLFRVQDVVGGRNLHTSIYRG